MHVQGLPIGRTGLFFVFLHVVMMLSVYLGEKLTLCNNNGMEVL